jgi:hypothetical protein
VLTSESSELLRFDIDRTSRCDHQRERRSPQSSDAHCRSTNPYAASHFALANASFQLMQIASC